MVLLFARAKVSESYVRYLFPLLAPLHRLQYGVKSIGTWSVRTHCIQPTTIHIEIFKRSDWLMSTGPVPILLAPYCTPYPCLPQPRSCLSEKHTNMNPAEEPLNPATYQGQPFVLSATK
jgi:hypothetical protein